MALPQPLPETAWWQQNRLLWALEQALAKQRERQDARRRRAWQARLQRAIAERVLAYPWHRYWSSLRKAAGDEPPPPVPEDLVNAFAAVVDMVQEIWDDAAKEASARAMVERYDEIFARRIFEQGVAATMHEVRGIEETLRERLQVTLREAMQQGESSMDFARRVRQLWQDVSRTRAELIAWTEWARGVETMSYATLVAGGVPYKVWITVGDSHVCPVCKANAEQGPILTQQPFQGGVLHAPQHPRCRCTISGLRTAEV